MIEALHYDSLKIAICGSTSTRAGSAVTLLAHRTGAVYGRCTISLFMISTDSVLCCFHFLN